MDKNRVLEALQTLRGELTDADLEPSSRAALEQVTAEIERKLARDKPLAAEDSASMSGRLQDALLGFETEHPQITGAVNQVAAALANLGI
ncbi:MAG: hypothetical protein DCC67_16490 [Planctomycetota bacterium]|nr:MAG: hypothetical protein DCC67_16490 [Planctomycetota bacterium]